MRYLSFIFNGRASIPSPADDTKQPKSASNVDVNLQQGSEKPDPAISPARISAEADDSSTAPGMAQKEVDEKTPLLHNEEDDGFKAASKNDPTNPSLLRRWTGAVNGTFQIIISTLLSPGRWLITCFYDDDGRFSALMPLYRVSRLTLRKSKKRKTRHRMSKEQDYSIGSESTSTKGAHNSMALVTDSESESMASERQLDEDDSPARHTRSKSLHRSAGDTATSSRANPSIRIKVLDNNGRQSLKHDSRDSHQLMASSIKSPTSPTSSLRLTKYPRAPAPPRPLVPRRQPSYTSSLHSSFKPNRKTLIIDLDETLIHSMAKGGRMSTGHMVEVKLQSPVGAGGTIIAPQVPILYYVHKRPHCDDFLRKVSKWYNLIVFTASVQEYADPVIDWLELERKYFAARYYRQHCTYRNGAYIKDLGQVEPDLSKVMILDNSPLSYIFHEDNAIPIEGWISDPTDNDLLHLIPFFEALQHTTDVRSLLALRLGEANQPQRGMLSRLPLGISSRRSNAIMSSFMGHSYAAGNMSSDEETLSLPPPRADQTYVTVGVVNNGYLTLPERLFVEPADPDKGITVPSLAFFINHPGSEPTSQMPQKCLFDLGLRSRLEDYTELQQKHLATRQPYKLGPGLRQTLLEDAGIRAGDIDTIFLSHVHWDHTGDPCHFPSAKFVVGHGSLLILQDGLPGMGSHQHFDTNLLPQDRVVELPDPLRGKVWRPFGPFPRALDFFGDGSVYVIDAPGHLPGHVNLLCRISTARWVYLCGDSYHDKRLLTGQCQIACWDADNVDGRSTRLSIHLDAGQAAKHIQRLRKLADTDHAVELVASHDLLWLQDNEHRLLPKVL